MLVGVPGSGKSTWVSNQSWTQNCVYASTDRLIEQYADSVGKTYSQVFESYIKTATKKMNEIVIDANKNQVDVIWDQTNLTKNSRKKKLDLLPNHQAIAVLFSVPNPQELRRRLDSRPGKIISDNLIHKMLRDFESVSLDEGFTEIWFT